MNERPADDLSRLIEGLTPEQRELLLRRAERAGGVERPPRIVPQRSDTDVYPLSFAQQRLWFLDRLNPGSPFYNVALGTRLEGALDADALIGGLRGIIRRHGILRTTFTVGDGEGVQVISPDERFDCTFIDLRGYPRERREREARRLAAAEAERPFDLERGPLLRIMLIKLGEEEHILIRVMHHIVCDGWSVGVFNRELEEIYGGLRAGKHAPLPPLPIQYVDFAVYQRSWLRGAVLDELLDWWLGRLRGAGVLLMIPSDRPRPPVQTFEGALYPFSLPASTHGSLRAFCEREEVTPYMILLSVYHTLLHRYTGQTDVVVGSPIANRNHKETEGLIGFFANTLVTRTDFSLAPRFSEVLAGVKSMTVGAYTHQDLPFEKLVDALGLDRSLGYTPLVQAAFAFQNTPQQDLRLPGLSSRSFPVKRDASIFDMTLYVMDAERDLPCTVEYSTDLFDEGTIERMSADFITLLDTVLADRGVPIAELAVPTVTPDVLGRKRRNAAAGMVRDHHRPESHARRLESLLTLHPGVRRSAVIEDAGGPHGTIAYVVPRQPGMHWAPSADRYELPNGMTVFHLNRNETEFMFHEIFTERCYMKHGITLADGSCIFDVGANIGLFALFASGVCKHPSIFAFEPVPPLFEILKANMDRHGVTVTALNCGLSDAMRTSTVAFYPRSSIMSGYYADHGDDEAVLRAFIENQYGQGVGPGALTGEMEEELVTGRLERRELSCAFDTFSNVVRRFGVETVDLLKIDVEKSEHDVISGIADGDWDRIRQLVVEVHDIDGRLAAVTEMLAGRGYRIAVEQDPLFAGTNIFSVYARGARHAHRPKSDVTAAGAHRRDHAAIAAAGAQLLAAEGKHLRDHASIAAPGAHRPAARTEPLSAGQIAAFLEAHGVAEELMPRIEVCDEIPERIAARPAALRRKSAEDRITLAIASTFTAEPIADHLSWFCRQGGITTEIHFAPYNQVFQQLLDEGCLMSKNRGANIILLRFEDFARDLRARDPEDLITALDDLYDRLIEALRAAAERNPSPHLIALLPYSRPAEEDQYHRTVAEHAGALAERLKRDIAGTENIHLADLRDLAGIFDIADPFDRRGDAIAHMPFTPAFYAAVGASAARFVWSMRKPPFKAIVVDCDNTLWKGVCGEDGPLGIHVEPDGAGKPYHGLQEVLKDRMRNGMLLALCSKNNEDDVWKVFDRNRNMVLGRDDIAAARINWLPKSRNIEELARELNIGLDGMIFLDDEPAEIADVRTNCPDVLSIQLPKDPRHISRFLRHIWAFDQHRVTEVDRRRTSMYRAEAARRKSLERAPSMKDFLAGLDLTVALRRPINADMPRMAQLSQRTNQFNMNGERKTVPEIGRYLKEKQNEALVAEVSDRFGYYGTVGVLLYRRAEGKIVLDTFLLSCRALGKGVEDAILDGLRGRHQDTPVTTIAARYIPTGRNTPFKQFLDRTGWREKHRGGGDVLLELPLSAISVDCDHVTILHERRLDEMDGAAIEMHTAEKSEKTGAGGEEKDERRGKTAGRPSRTEERIAAPEARLHHIGIAVPILEEAGELFRSLGFSCGGTVRDPLQNVDLAMCTGPSGERFELITSVDETSPCNRIIEVNGGGPYHFAVCVANVGGFLSYLRSEGCRITVVRESTEAALFEGARVTFIYVGGIGLIEVVEERNAGSTRERGGAGTEKDSGSKRENDGAGTEKDSGSKREKVGTADVTARIVTNDAAEARRFLRLIGLQTDVGEPSERGGIRTTSFRGPGFTRFEIIEPFDDRSPEYIHLTRNGTSMYQILFEIDTDEPMTHPARDDHWEEVAPSSLFGSLAGVKDAVRARGAPYLILHGRGEALHVDEAAADWDVGAFNREHMRHSEYLIPLEHHSARHLLRIKKEVRSEHDTGRRYVAPRTETEKMVAAIWETLIGVQPVGVDDNFFKIGGNSMIAVQVVTRILKEYGIELPLAAVFETPTVAGLSDTLESYLWLARGGADRETDTPEGGETAEF